MQEGSCMFLWVGRGWLVCKVYSPLHLMVIFLQCSFQSIGGGVGKTILVKGIKGGGCREWVFFPHSLTDNVTINKSCQKMVSPTSMTNKVMTGRPSCCIFWKFNRNMSRTFFFIFTVSHKPVPT